jgi:hypothetical protein
MVYGWTEMIYLVAYMIWQLGRGPNLGPSPLIVQGLIAKSCPCCGLHGHPFVTAEHGQPLACFGGTDSRIIVIVQERGFK